MIDPGNAVTLFERFGRQIVDLLWLPSLEALLLGVLVWVLLQANRGCPPWIRHFLWLLVLVKPLLTLVVPWHGPFEMPWAPMTVSTSAAAGGQATTISNVYAAAGLVWMVFAGFGLYRICSSVITMIRRRQRSVPVAVPRVSALFDRCLAEAGLKRNVALRVSDEFEVPVLIAAGRPVVVIPSWCILELSSAELRQVLLHELAHYARRDHLTVFLVQFSRICFFFHPAVWYAAYRAGIEAERACDADVVRVSRQPERYASTLLKVASGKVRTHWQAALELARSASMAALRIRDVLGSTANRKDRAFFSLLSVGVCTVLAVTPLLRPTVEAPEDVSVSSRSAQTEGILEPSIPSWNGPAAAGRPDRVVSTPAAEAVRVESAPSSPDWDDPRTMVDGQPGPRRTLAAMMMKQAIRRSDGISESLVSQRINPAVLGPAAAADIAERAVSQGDPFQQGRIEVQGLGRTGNTLFESGTVSLSAGYFLTPTHQFGGVFSIRQPSDTEAFDDTRRSPGASYGGPLLRARKLPGFGSTAARVTALETPEEEQVDRITRIGAFYRYNLLVPGGSFTPFFGWGTGLELRPQNRHMTMIDAGVGLRYFWERHIAVVVQASYRKELDVTSSPYPEMTLGFSAIF